MYNKNIQRLEPVIAKVMNQLRGVFEDITSKTLYKNRCEPNIFGYS